MSTKYYVDFNALESYVSLSAWMIVLGAALNAYMDASLRATTGGKYYPEGWS